MKAKIAKVNQSFIEKVIQSFICFFFNLSQWCARTVAHCTSSRGATRQYLCERKNVKLSKMIED